MSQNSVLNEIRVRWSPRAYSNRPVELEKLQRIFEAARWAPSAFNGQPWYFLIGHQGDETYKLIGESMVEFNQLWALNAPVLLATVVKNTSPSGNHVYTAPYDLGQAVAYLSLQATNEGLHVHQMSGFDRGLLDKAFEIPDGYSTFSLIAIGYMGSAEDLHESLKEAEKRERVRRPLAETVFNGKFGVSTPQIL